jgi:hypothetical protein
MKKTLVALLGIGMAIAVLEAAPRIKVRAEPDPTFDFATVRTWAWDVDAGDVIMGARSRTIRSRSRRASIR